MSGPPATYSEAPSMAGPAATSDTALPVVMAPYKRAGTDVVSRQLDIFPYPNGTVNSSNASQILRFDLPPSVMLDTISQGLEFNFKLQIIANSSLASDTFKRIQAMPGECLGHLINTIRTYINNEMVEETLNFGQLSSMMQQITENVVDQSCFEQNVKGRYMSMSTFPYEIRGDGQMLIGAAQYVVGNVAVSTGSTTVTFTSNPLQTTQSLFDPNIAANSGLFLTLFDPLAAAESTPTIPLTGTTEMTEIATFNTSSQTATVQTSVLNDKQARYIINGNGYNIPQSFRNQAFSLYAQKDALQKGVKFRIPLAMAGQMFNQRQGLFPLHRLPKVRIEITFNPASLVLWSPTSQSAVNTPSNFAAQDYQLSEMRITAMYCQSPSLVALYDSGNWEYSFLGYNFYTVPVVAGSSFLLPISTPFKSSRYLIGVFSNQAQYNGILPTADSGDRGLPLLNGQIVQAFPVASGQPGYVANQIIASADPTRWSNWYGFGGCYGGASYVDNTSEATLVQNGSGLPASAGCYQGRDPTVYPTQINYQQNNEWIFQQDLQGRDQFWRELTKVLPAVKRSTFFNVTNYPGIRFVLAINLQTPELSDQFMCGNRAAQGQSLAYLKLNLNNPSMVAGCTFQSWIVYDRVVKVQEKSGLTIVDY